MSARDRMVDEQLVARDIVDPLVLRAMRAVPREAFVPASLASRAFEDGPLAIGMGQTISQPYVVALMAQALSLAPGDHVLEIGTGSGYGAAVLSRLARDVVTIERHDSLAFSARERLRELAYGNVEVVVGDGTLGWIERAPYDAIAVTAAGPSIPPSLLAQLAPGGRLVMPVGTRDGQRLLRIQRDLSGEDTREDLGAVQFVPLVGAEGVE